MKWNVTPLLEVKGEEIFLLHNLAASKFYAFLETRYEEGVQKNKKLQEGAPQCAEPNIFCLPSLQGVVYYLLLNNILNQNCKFSFTRLKVIP